mgnify:CR=1 FL=1
MSDSEGEKGDKRPPPKSPDSTISSKLYDPFDILNSPSNENVTSSQTTTTVMAQKPPEKLPDLGKSFPTFNKNVMAMATNSNLFFNEENLVTSSSSLMTNEKSFANLPPLPKNIDIHLPPLNETVPMDIVESPYSPGHDYDESFPQPDEDAGNKTKGGKGTNIFDELFGISSPPPGLDKIKSKKGKIFLTKLC